MCRATECRHDARIQPIKPSHKNPEPPLLENVRVDPGVQPVTKRKEMVDRRFGPPAASRRRPDVCHRQMTGKRSCGWRALGNEQENERRDCLRPLVLTGLPFSGICSITAVCVEAPLNGPTDSRETLEKENKPFLYGCARQTRSKQPATLCEAWNDWKVRGERRGRDIIVWRPRGHSKAGWCGRKSLFFNLRINSLASPEKRDIKNTVKHLLLHRLANSNENITQQDAGGSRWGG